MYVALRCEEADLPGLLAGVARAGGAGNVTIPHKAAAVGIIQVPSPPVERTGVCNTFWLEDHRIHGDNTDVEGFRAAARSLIGPVAGARVLILGAGGAARAAVVGLLDGRADAVHVLNRTVDRSRRMAKELDPAGRRLRVLEAPEVLAREGYDLVVNATSLGLAPDDPPPLDLELPARVGAVLDLVYRPDGPRGTSTDWVRAALARDLLAADGLGMLLEQGAASFRRWFGIEPDRAVMRQAVGLSAATT